MLYISIFFSVDLSRPCKRERWNLPLDTSMQFLFSFLLPNWHPVFSTSVTLLIIMPNSKISFIFPTSICVFSRELHRH